jgi:hypothetical protein
MPDIYLIYEAIRTAGNLVFPYALSDNADWEYEEFQASRSRPDHYWRIHYFGRLARS